jgi:hypothetical protein
MLKLKEYLVINFDVESIFLHINSFEKIEITKTELTLKLIELLTIGYNKFDIISILTNDYKFKSEDCKSILNDFINYGFVEECVVCDSKYERFKRQLLLFDILKSRHDYNEDVQHIQDLLKNAHVVIHGTGGIGNYVSLSLVASGVGKITLIDNDNIELSNLNRQILFTENDIGKHKVDTAKARLKLLYSDVKINTINEFASNQDEIISLYNKIDPFNVVILSADSSPDLQYWIDYYRNTINFDYAIIPCGYIGDIGVVGPLVDNSSKRYTELIIKDDYKTTEIEMNIINNQNQNFHPPSATFLNAIVSNIAALETVKYIAKLDFSTLYNKRMYISSENYKITIE